MKTETPVTIRLADYKPLSWRILSVDLDFALDPAETIVTANLEIEAAHDNAGPLHLDGEALKLLDLAIDGRKLAASDYALSEKALVLHAPPPRFRLTTKVSISPAANTALSGLYASGDILCTQCEAEGFRRITYYPDRPDNMSVFRVRISADEARYPTLLSNGNPVESGKLADGRHFAVWEDPFKKPSYLFALVAGRFGMLEDHFTTASGRKVTLRIFTDPGKEQRGRYALDSLKSAMKWDEEAYGREYDLDIFMIVAVSAYNAGAMENKGLNVFNDRYALADPDTATDTDFAFIESIVAHEYFHNWTGNRITCRDWFQLCLKEGFTVLRDQQFSADMRSEAVHRISEVKTLRARQFPEDAGPLAHPVRPEAFVEIDNFYTATVYDKGAEVCRMLKTLLGAERFRRGTDYYFDKHDGEAATVEAFAASFENANKVDLSQFKLWWSQAGTPEIDVHGTYEEKAQTYSLTVKQTLPPTPGQPVKKPMHIPLAVGLVGAGGVDLPLQLEGENAASDGTRVLELREAEQRFTFVNVATRPVPSLGRHFSAPVKIRSNLSAEDRAFLMGRDSDLFNRWDAGQQFALDMLIRLTADVRAGRTLAVDPHFIHAIGHVLDDAARDPAFTALALSLPPEAEIALALPGDADPAAIHTARNFVNETLARVHAGKFRTLRDRFVVKDTYDPGAEQSGRRALANAALRFIAMTDGPAEPMAQFERGGNMTDVMAALTILNDIAGPERERALDAFHDRWRDEPLVLDKWMSLQAMSCLPGTLARVKALTKHPHFSHHNPNRFRALVGAFAYNNPLHFHAADGSGYAFVAQELLIEDKINPQVAARPVTTFESFRRYTAERQAHARAALTMIASKEDISVNLREMVERTLAG